MNGTLLHVPAFRSFHTIKSLHQPASCLHAPRMELRFRLARRVLKTLPLQGMRLDIELDFPSTPF